MACCQPCHWLIPGSWLLSHTERLIASSSETACGSFDTILNITFIIIFHIEEFGTMTIILDNITVGWQYIGNWVGRTNVHYLCYLQYLTHKIRHCVFLQNLEPAKMLMLKILFIEPGNHWVYLIKSFFKTTKWEIIIQFLFLLKHWR